MSGRAATEHGEGPKNNYAEKRRPLREHRAEMRVTHAFNEERGLGAKLQERIAEITGNTYLFLGWCEMDERSDEEESEETLKGLVAEARDEQRFIRAVAGALGLARGELQAPRSP